MLYLSKTEKEVHEFFRKIRVTSCCFLVNQGIQISTTCAKSCWCELFTFLKKKLIFFNK